MQDRGCNPYSPGLPVAGHMQKVILIIINRSVSPLVCGWYLRCCNVYLCTSNNLWVSVIKHKCDKNAGP